MIATCCAVGVCSRFIPAYAGDCFADPVTQTDYTGTTNIGLFMRDKACMEGSSVLTTIPQGTSIHLMGKTDGWYYVDWNGSRGWMGASLITVAQKRFDGPTWSYSEFMSKFPAIDGDSSATPADPEPDDTPASSDGSFVATNAALVSRVKGYILLQTQAHGEAWYLDPVSSKRYYMKDGPTAYQMLRTFGLGTTEADYAKIAAGDSALKQRLRGRIVLRVQAHGEAYYIHPKDLKVYYLQNGNEAYRIMRLYSLGITNADLSGIRDAELAIK